MNQPVSHGITAGAERRDEWSDWLLNLRHAGDPRLQEMVRKEIRKEADRVIDGADLAADSYLIDVGAGDGLVGFRALERLGGRLRVLFTDISAPMLEHVRLEIHRRHLGEQCAVIQAGAENLREIKSECADVVITRASLAYVADKPGALAEFHRVLKPGGRISLAEPVLQDEAFVAMALRRVLESKPAAERDPYMTWRHRCLAAQFPDTHEGMASNPLINFSERDVLCLAKAAGFMSLHMEVHFDIEPSKIKSWDLFIGASPHPWAPTLKSILETQFSSDERAAFERITRPMVERGEALSIGRSLYLTATKPDQAVTPLNLAPMVEEHQLEKRGLRKCQASGLRLDEADLYEWLAYLLNGIGLLLGLLNLVGRRRKPPPGVQ